jgi:citrate lyase subunit beta/citryl-CoA lyase
MRYRSWLLVPGDNEKKLGKAMAMGADVVVVDLDETVPFEAKSAARALAGEWLSAYRRQVLEQAPMARWVRINPLDSQMWRDDLIAVMRGAPEGIILPRAEGPEKLRDLAAELYELEQVNQLAPGSTKILPLAGDTPRAALGIGAYADAAIPRLAGLTWSADRLATAIDATRQRELRGGSTDPFRFVRAQVLLVSHACGVMPIEAMHDDVEDIKGLKLAAKAARADGFTGMFAGHPAQIAEINAAFTPSEADLAAARQIVAAGDDEMDADLSPIDRRRIDQPQVKFAKQILGTGDLRGNGVPPLRMLRPA